MLRSRRRARKRPVDRLPHPGRVIAGAFLLAVAVGTGLLSIPAATASGERADLVDALFTATSAVCITGLTVVDTGSHWSTLGQVLILVLVQVGGLGIMTLASVVALLLSRRLGLRARVLAQAETKSLTAGDIRRVVRNVVLFSFGFEALLAIVLTTRFALADSGGLGAAAYAGVFYAICAFNNAGFGLEADSLVQYVGDPWVTLPVAVGVIVGGLGFPVVFELRRSWRRPKTWSVLTRLTVFVTGALLFVGTLGMLITEGTNERTLGPLSSGDKLSAAFFAGVMPRSGGFNSVDLAQMRPETLFFTDVLMFIGGGSASTAGGIKVTTFGLLAYVLWAEVRGDPDVEVGRRRVPATNQRQALSVALLSVGLVVVATMTMLTLTDLSLDVALFETLSASATVGLSTGAIPHLPTSAQLLLVALMYVGRIGPLTLASGLALRERPRLHQLPHERTIVG